MLFGYSTWMDIITTKYIFILYAQAHEHILRVFSTCVPFQKFTITNKKAAKIKKNNGGQVSYNVEKNRNDR